MALSNDDFQWLTTQFKEVSTDVRLVVKEHEDRYHPPGRPLKTIGALLAIGVSGATLLGIGFAFLMWLIRTAPK